MAIRKKNKQSSERGKAGIADYAVLRSPVFTEKSSLIASSKGSVVFRVAQTASKIDIKQAVERIFNVDVAAVRTCSYLGKTKRTQRSTGRRSGYKKAYVTLKEGQTIDIVEGL